MSTRDHLPTPSEPWPGWTPSRAAQSAYGQHLPAVAAAVHRALFLRAYDWFQMVERWRTSPGPERNTSAELEQRDDLLDAAASLDLIALCHGPGPYEPDTVGEEGVTPPAEEVRGDAARLAQLLVAHDRMRPAASRTGVPDIDPDGDDDRTKDAARAYVRAEWAAREER